MKKSCKKHCTSCNDTNDLKKRSAILTSTPSSKDWTKRAAARAMMRGVGYKDEDFEKPLICVASPYSDVSPCNAHIDQLAQVTEKAIAKVGGKPYMFGTPVITDGETMERRE